MRPNLITRLKEEWNNLDPVDPLRGLIADAIDALAEQPAQQQEPFIYYRHYDGGTQDYPDEKTIPLYTSPQPAQQQEPVGEIGKIVMFGGDLKEVSWKNGKMPPVGSVLYTSPPANANAGKPWVGLTDEERGQVYANWRFNGSGSSNLELCRTIEAKLREKNQ